MFNINTLRNESRKIYVYPDIKKFKYISKIYDGICLIYAI